MSSSLNHIPVAVHPAIRNLNVRQISKIIATKIIETTALQLQFNPKFCKLLDVSQHLNTYEAIAYFTDHQYFEKYGFNNQKIISFQELYEGLLSVFHTFIPSE